jgi:carboxypeptidase C (cathepsin A)
MLAISFALFALMAVDAAPAADEVASLPGFAGKLPSKHYSGYLPARGGAHHVHYYLQLSEGDPASDPVTLWSNGGPGCTSLKGAFEELGQLVFNRDSMTLNQTSGKWEGAAEGGVPKLFYNPLSWTKKSSMLYFEHPTGVGFSYCDSCLGKSGCNCAANDTTAAEDNYDVLTGFFEAFPEFKKNDFYITGESYAGIYMPMLIGQIMEKGGVDNLKGAAIGNGCTGRKSQYFRNHRCP